MKKPMRRMLILVSIFFAIVFGVYGVKKALFMYFMSHYKPPAVTVAAKDVAEKPWNSFIQAVGTIRAINGVELSSQVPGIIKEIRFTPGQIVNAGDVLILLDTSIQEANLKSAIAKLQLSQISFDREQTLFKRKVISKANLDSSVAELSQAQASVEAAKAEIKQRTITAPFAGHIGIRLIDLGQYVSPGTPMVTLQSFDPLYVMFTLPEQNINNLYLDQPVDIQINNSDHQIIRGKITAINTKVEESTRNVLVQATIPNENGKIYPGMFANVRIILKDEKERIVIPQVAISYSLSGDYVFIINQDKDKKFTVQRRYVNVGERRGDEVVILKGLKPGEKIVTAGQVKLQNGASININNDNELS